MIKASILDADSDDGGELLRLLVHHPDVTIVNAQSTDRDGQLVCEYHYGLVGDTDLRFSADADLSKTDVIFLCRPGADISGAPDDVKIIDLTGEKLGHEGFVLGIGELNRKDLVRGATRATIPSAAVQAAVITILPLAKRGELRGDITLDVPADTNLTVIEAALRALQPDFTGRIIARNQTEDQTFTARATFATNCTGSDIRALYREAYDDHNFVFVIPRIPVTADITNTNKCLLHLNVDNNELTITALMDSAIKGSAGTAVHCMNLIFGLHEVIGLQFKAFGRSC